MSKERRQMIVLLVIGLVLMAWSVFVSPRVPGGNPMIATALGAGLIGYSGFMLVRR